MTQAQLAKAVGVETNTVSRWELGSVPRQREVLERLAEVLGVSVEHLTGAGSGEGGEESAPAPEARREAEPAPAARGAPRVAMGLPYEIRVWLQGFLLEITKAGATEEDVNEARELLTSPELFVYWSGGAPREFTEADTLETMQAIGDVVIKRALRKRGLKL